MPPQAHDHRTQTGAAAARPQHDTRNAGARAGELHGASRSAAMRQLISRSVLHGPALRSLLAAGR